MAQGAWGDGVRVQVVQGAGKSFSFLLQILQASCCGCRGGGRGAWRRERGGSGSGCKWFRVLLSLSASRKCCISCKLPVDVRGEGRGNHGAGRGEGSGCNW